MAALQLKKELDQHERKLIVQGIIDNKTTGQICSELNISLMDLHYQLRKYPDFAKDVLKSREIWTHNQVETLITIADDAVTMAEVQRAKVKSDNIKWVAGKYVPDVYGDNINLNVNHSLDLSSVLLAAENRILPILATSRPINNTIDISETIDPCTITEKKTITIDELL